MEQLKKDLAVFAHPGFLITVALLVTLYAVGVIALISTCSCL